MRWGNGCETRNRVPGMFSHTSLAAAFHAVLGMLAEFGSRARASTWRKLCLSTVCIGNRHDVQIRLHMYLYQTQTKLVEWFNLREKPDAIHRRARPTLGLVASHAADPHNL